MASIANIDAEINSIKVNHDEPPPLNENEIHSKTPESITEQNDSRVTDPDGAQSPASSTYADCEDQNDISVSETPSEDQSKETHNDKDNEATSANDNNNVDKQESPHLNKLEVAVTDDNKSVDKNQMNDNTKPEEIEDDLRAAPSISIDSTEKIAEEDAEEKLSHNNNIEKCIPDDQYHEISENEEDVYIDEEEYLDDEHFEELNEKSGPDDECSEGGNDQHEEDRENGDGQEGNEDEEAAAQKELDDDEDRRNPQYIPKRGFFYEHDDRTAGTSEDEASEGAKKEAEAKEAETAKGKNRRLIPDGRWQHDLYREDEQRPKSAQELIDIYGYDIRNEEAAPKARRRRKYGRGPNKYTRKWDDEEAYAKQMSAKPFRGRNKTSFKKEEYDQDFPAMNERKSHPEHRSKEHPPQPAVLAKKSYNEHPRNDDYKYKDEYRTSNQKPNSSYHERSRNFSKRIPNAKEHRPPLNPENYETQEVRHVQKTARNSQFTSSNDSVVRGRGRGLGHGKNLRNPGNFEDGARLQFTAANRGRAKRLPRQSQHYHSSKQVPDEDVETLTEQMSAADLGSKSRNVLDKHQYSGDSENMLPNEQLDAQQNSLNAVSRSKRYSHQRQRLLPEVNKNATAAINFHQNVQQNMQPITHSVQNVASGFSQSMAPTHTSMSLMTQNQCTAPPQTVAAPLSVTPASVPSSSLAVSASLIPLSAPPLTASGHALSAGAPPLPIMGFFQHPQAGFTNQATPAQLYTRDQTVMGAPSNQPVQLVAFLPASPILSNTNHSQTAPPPPPPPPPPGFPTSVMSYQQNTQTPQNAASYNSDSYTMPPVTLASIHQPPEVYQSRGGVTYYNTRSQVKPRSPPPPRVKIAIPIVPPPASETLK